MTRYNERAGDYADELKARVIELELQLIAGIAAAREAVANWEKGNLAEAVNNLSHWAGRAEETLY